MSNPATPKIARSTWFAGLVWLAIVLASTFLMLAYANSPGGAGAAPKSWPTSSQVPRDAGRPTLVMFIHPRCPCSRASIGELAVLMAHCQGRVNARVYCLKPAQMPPDWEKTDSWRAAAEIPGVTVHTDESGSEARRFHSETSGDVVLYNAGGKLVFHGGITSARAHSGDNAGRSAVQALLFNQPAATAKTPVFGCSLFSCRDQNQTNQ